MNTGTPVGNETRAVYVDDHVEAAGLFEDAFSHLQVVNLKDPDWIRKLDDALRDAELIITDWDLSEMAIRDFLPADGKAMNEVIRAKRRNNPINPLFTIFTGKLDQIPNAEHHAGRPHVLAQDIDVEWAGSKEDGVEFRRQVLLLCDARRALRSMEISATDITQDLCSLFALDTNVAWANQAIADIERSQPPVQHLYGSSKDERVFLRWMTRSVLPYPTFLLDSFEVAVRLRLEPDATNHLLSDPSSDLSRGLAAVQYRGILAGFLGARWWNAALADWMWAATEGNPFNIEGMLGAVRKAGGDRVQILEQRDPVLLRDEFGRPSRDDLVADAAEAVRIQPDEWPAAAPWPWARISTVAKDPILRAIVLPDDRHALKENG